MFGVCLYFLHLGKPAKEIPAHTVDEGCKYFVEKDEDKESVKFTQLTIELFNGEIIKDEKKKKTHYKKKKTIKDTRHKYGKRKDW